MTNLDVCPMCHHKHCTMYESPHHQLHYCQTRKGAKISENTGRMIRQGMEDLCGCLWSGTRFLANIREFERLR